MVRLALGLLLLAAAPACNEGLPTTARKPPTFLLGDFMDDYGVRYSISEDLWEQRPAARYHVQRWHRGDHYLVARNDEHNPSEAGLWTRIDWVSLEEHGEYEWAFCYSVYDATSEAAARSGARVDRSTPRTGCNGHPFSRMKRVIVDHITP